MAGEALFQNFNLQKSNLFPNFNFHSFDLVDISYPTVTHFTGRPFSWRLFNLGWGGTLPTQGLIREPPMEIVQEPQSPLFPRFFQKKKRWEVWNKHLMHGLISSTPSLKKGDTICSLKEATATWHAPLESKALYLLFTGVFRFNS